MEELLPLGSKSRLCIGEMYAWKITMQLWAKLSFLRCCQKAILIYLVSIRGQFSIIEFLTKQEAT